jgi:hypothetical protein
MKTIIYIITISALLAACGTSRTISTRLTQSINSQAVIEKKLQELIQQIDQQRESELKKGDIDENISNVIETKTTVIEKQSKTRYQEMKQVLDSIKLLYKDSVANRAELDQKIKQSVVMIEKDVMMVEAETGEMQLIKNYLGETTFNKFNSAQFFPSGGYKVPSEFRPKAEAAFAPIIDQVVSFAKQYPGKRLIATIITKGYADEGPVGKNSPSYARLKEMVGKENPTRKELNKALSYLRAEEMGDILRAMLLQRKKTDLQLQDMQITLMVEGRGEEYPNGTIKNYKPVDERRRIVAFYWSVLTE